jgi:hypothetical protein
VTRNASLPLDRTTVVRKEGLEPSRGYPLEPKSSASTSSATFALEKTDQRMSPRRRGGAEYTRRFRADDWPLSGDRLRIRSRTRMQHEFVEATECRLIGKLKSRNSMQEVVGRIGLEPITN